MIKNIVFISLTIFSFYARSQNFIAIYSFADVTAATGITDPTPTPTVQGMALGSFTAIGTSTAANASGRFSFTRWPTGSIHGTNSYSLFTGNLSSTTYYEVMLSPQAGYSLSLQSITFGVRRSGTGIRNFCVRSSLDNYSSNLAAFTGTGASLSVIPTNIFFWKYDSISPSGDLKGSSIIPGAAFGNITTPVTIRFYAWNAEAPGGTFSIDNVAFTGMVTNGTEPNYTGFGDAEDQTPLILYPNPVTSELTIRARNAFHKIELRSPTGLLLETWEGLSDNNKIILQLDLPDGVYTISASSAGRVKHQKMIICR